MKQHARNVMVLLAAFLGGAVEGAGALPRVHPPHPAEDRNPSQSTATYNIAGWRLHVTTSNLPVRDIAPAETTTSIYRLTVLDANDRYVAVDVSYVGPSESKTRLGFYALWHDVPSALDGDTPPQSQLHAADMPLFIMGSDPNSPWNRRFEPVGEHDGFMGTEAGMRPSSAAVSGSRRRGSGATRRDTPDLASMVVGSPGVVLLTGFGVILIGHQMRRRLN